MLTKREKDDKLPHQISIKVLSFNLKKVVGLFLDIRCSRKALKKTSKIESKLCFSLINYWSIFYKK